MSRSPFKKAVNPALSQVVERDALFGLSDNFPKLVEVDVDRIDPNPDQPRKVFDEDALQELADSIRRLGLKQPIGLREAEGGRYTLVFGARRLEAVRLLGSDTVFGILTTGDPAEIALIENIQRVDLTPFEEADGYARLIDRHNYTHEALASVVHKSRPMVTKYLGLRSLPEAIRDAYADTRPPLRVLFQIAALPDEQRVPAWNSYADALKARLASSARPAEAEPRERPDRQDEPAVALSAFPLRVARAVNRVRVSLDAFRQKPTPLYAADREALREIRRHIDEILGE
ncbi:ParB/RepB/Spo0J family partition protein [Azospirillum sp.]|uniref:ParB/RepB/Spo0J family partition protein n=1 Tax=Azospirillum sp. TaxID=34012 RepID=UPI003D730E76